MDPKITRSLFFLRISVFLVMLMWTLDKFVNPDNTAKIFAHYYFIPNLSEAVSYLIGSFQLLIILLFLFGYKKKLSYGLVLLMQMASTFAAYGYYFKPWDGNLLFFSAWPMLAACLALYSLREYDTLMSHQRKMF